MKKIAALAPWPALPSSLPATVKGRIGEKRHHRVDGLQKRLRHAGADRATLAFLCEAYTEDEAPDEKGKLQTRTVMKFHPRLAPIKAAVFPLVNKDGMPEVAERIYRHLKQHYVCQFDVKQSIGKRYARMDEAGTPFCFTIDGASDDFHRACRERVVARGRVWISTTRLGGRLVLRACICNERTGRRQVQELLEDLEAARREES